MYFNGSYPTVLYRCPLRVSSTIVYASTTAASTNAINTFTIHPPQLHPSLPSFTLFTSRSYTLPLVAIVYLGSMFYSDDFALKNRRVLQYDPITFFVHLLNVVL